MKLRLALLKPDSFYGTYSRREMSQALRAADEFIFPLYDITEIEKQGKEREKMTISESDHCSCNMATDSFEARGGDGREGGCSALGRSGRKGDDKMTFDDNGKCRNSLFALRYYVKIGR